MNPTVAARQIRAAKIAREAAPAVRLAYTTTTGDAPRPTAPARHDEDFMIEEYCFLCHRATDHLGEHDNYEALGLVEYRTTPTTYYVVRSEAYDTRPDLVAQARKADDDEVSAWLARCTA